MKIALIGATGYTGTRIRDEALRRGHLVTAIVRNADALPRHLRVTPVALNVTDTARLTTVIAGHDAAISAFNPGKDETGSGAKSIIDAVKRNGRMRLLVVGGAGSLEIEPGKRVVDQPDFPLNGRMARSRPPRCWKCFARRANSTGPSFRRRPSFHLASAQASIISAATSCSSTTRDGAASRSRTIQLPWSTKSKTRVTSGPASAWHIDCWQHEGIEPSRSHCGNRRGSLSPSERAGA